MRKNVDLERLKRENTHLKRENTHLRFDNKQLREYADKLNKDIVALNLRLEARDELMHKKHNPSGIEALLKAENKRLKRENEELKGRLREERSRVVDA